MSDIKQWVCVPCGFNMIGAMPDICPFCGARHDQFVTWEEAERSYHVTSERVNGRVTQLRSIPRLGIEHAAYRVETDAGAVWIDCPSAFNRDLDPVSAIYFTHKDFLGASNQYRSEWNAEVCLHEADAALPLVASFPIDRRFTGDFTERGIEAVHIGGHSPGFTIYIFEDVLFACDFAFPPGPTMRLNPFGPKSATREGAKRLYQIVRGRTLATVCGYNYVAPFEAWTQDFARAIAAA